MLSIVFSTYTSSQSRDFQERIFSYLRNPILPSDESFAAYLKSASILAISDDDVQPTQVSYVLSITMPVFSYTQGKLHDNESTVTDGYSLRFSENESMPAGI